MFTFIMKATMENKGFIVTDFKAGREEAFDIFFHSYYRAFVFFSCKLVNERDIAEDIVAESFIRLWDRREKLNSENELKNYMYRIVYNASLRWLERQKTQSKVYKLYTLNNPQSDNGFFENVVKSETIRRVLEAMNKLPNECRMVFVKLYVEGKSVKETAEELEVAVSTVKNQKARGVKLLRERLASSS
jgi:RNA polymerase sigma-70 factor (ECF subfamily)